MIICFFFEKRLYVSPSFSVGAAFLVLPEWWWSFHPLTCWVVLLSSLLLGGVAFPCLWFCCWSTHLLPLVTVVVAFAFFPWEWVLLFVLSFPTPEGGGAFHQEQGRANMQITTFERPITELRTKAPWSAAPMMYPLCVRPVPSWSFEE